MEFTFFAHRPAFLFWLRVFPRALCCRVTQGGRVNLPGHLVPWPSSRAVTLRVCFFVPRCFCVCTSMYSRVTNGEKNSQTALQFCLASRILLWIHLLKVDLLIWEHLCWFSCHLEPHRLQSRLHGSSSSSSSSSSPEYFL